MAANHLRMRCLVPPRESLASSRPTISHAVARCSLAVHPEVNGDHLVATMGRQKQRGTVPHETDGPGQNVLSYMELQILFNLNVLPLLSSVIND